MEKKIFKSGVEHGSYLRYSKAMPSNTRTSMFFYVYALRSTINGDMYIGYTNNLRRRVEEHNKGKSLSTEFRLPFRLIYFEGRLNKEDAMRRENYLKTTQGRKFIGLRLKEYQRSKRALGSRP